MAYSPWTKIDNGREGLWENKVLFGALQVIAKHQGEDVYDATSPIYSELEERLPARGWLKQEGTQVRPLFRDYSKPWTATGLVELTGQKFKLTPLGLQVASSECRPKDFYQHFLNNWMEDGERPFTEIASAFLEFNNPLSLKDIYFGVMLGYRKHKGDNAVASIQNARNTVAEMEDTPRRRLLVLLSILKSAGAIDKEDSKQSDAEARWIIWDGKLLEKIAQIGSLSISNAAANLDNLIIALHTSTTLAGLNYDKELVHRFASALLTKRFCVLTGLAGSGKTKLAEALTWWLCESSEQHLLVAVGADWTSNENLLGYADALKDGNYVSPSNGVLDLLVRANGNPDRPYFLILDEMNLSHVERYFADFLSAIESANPKLALHGQDNLKAGSEIIPAQLPLPNNFFILGTVNIDETTYMFSPKVLDRANVIEFRAGEIQMFEFLNAPSAVDLKALEMKGTSFASAFVQRAKNDVANLADANGTLIAPTLAADLIEVFNDLEKIGAEFGFRTAKEIARFIVIHKELSGVTWNYKDALDAQIIQKLMPKLHGSARKLGGVLEKLATYANKHDLTLTAEKVARMQSRLKRDGFTSFAEN